MTTQKDKSAAEVPPSTKPKLTGIIPAIVAIVVSASIAVIYTNFKLNKQTQQIAAQTKQIYQQQIENQTQIQLASTSLAATEKQFDERLTHLNQTLESALNERGYQSNDWILQKARYYLELAAINAHWSKNLQETAILLKQADTLLASVHGEQLFAIRQALAKEQTEVLQIPAVDMTGILAELDAIQHTIDKFLPRKWLAKKPIEEKNTANSSSTWRARLKASLQQLDSFIVIRHQDDLIQSLLTPTYEAMLRENIRFNLQEAQWAVLQQNQAVYDLSLEQSIDNIKRLFDAHEPQVNAIIDQLNTLKKRQLVQPEAVLGEALKLLNQLIDKPANPSGDAS